jgi:hypothetical protein
MAQNIEDFLPPIQSAGLNTLEDASFGGNVAVTGDLTVTGDISVDDITIDGLTTTGNTILGNATSDTTTVNGVLTVTSTATVVGIVDTGGATVKSGTAVPATAGAVAAGAPITMFSDGPSIYVTSDAPTFTAVKGSICINTGGSSTSTRLYVNNGTTNWVAITTAS